MDELIERTDAISIETPTSGMARSPSLDDDYFQDAAESLSVASTPRALSNTSEVVAELADSVETPTTSETELDAAAEAQGQEDLSALAPAPGTLGKQVSNGAAAAAQSHALEERMKIRDLDTGRLFYLDTGEWADGGTSRRTRPSQVTDMQSGQSMTMEEFDEAIGVKFSSLHKEMHKRGLEVVKGDDDDDDDEEEGNMIGKGLSGLGFNLKSIASRAGRKVGSLHRKMVGRDNVKGLRQHDESFSTANGKRQEIHGEELTEMEDEQRVGSPRKETNSSLWEDGKEGKAKKCKQRNRTKVYVHRKLYREFTDVRMGQELKGHQGAVWCMKISLDGQYLASAGQDAVVRVWEFLSPPPSTDNSVPVYQGDETDRVLTRKTFGNHPVRSYQGHKSDVLELCWSKTNFLISSSMDKTVRLWHASMDECLRIFEHSDFVTAIEFNPLNDKYFISGSLDEKLRMWNIPDHKVEDWVDIGEMVTAVCFSNNAKTAIVGSYKGKCRFYGVEDNKFKYVTQLDVKSTRGKNSKGKKITGLQFMPGDDSKLLVTSNDSRLRVYDGYRLICKYKGHKNANSQIKASFAPFGDFIVCGSEDECIYTWSTVNSYVPSINPIYTGYRKDRHASYECFPAHNEIVTVALVAPRQYYCVSKAALEKGDVPPSGSSADRLRGRTKEAEAQAALAAGEKAVMEATGTGLVLITAGYGGEIRIFENYGLPEWL